MRWWFADDYLKFDHKLLKASLLRTKLNLKPKDNQVTSLRSSAEEHIESQHVLLILLRGWVTEDHYTSKRCY